MKFNLIIKYKIGLCQENNEEIISSQEDDLNQQVSLKRGTYEVDKLTSDIVVENYSTRTKSKTSSTKQSSSVVMKLSNNDAKYKSKLNHTIRTTYMMVLLSKWFVILHVPYLISWMIYHIYMNKVYKSNNNLRPVVVVFKLNSTTTIATPAIDLDTIILLKAFQNLFEILFLFNYSVHFFLYLFNIPSFRRAHSNEINRFFHCIWRYLSCEDMRQISAEEDIN